MSPNDYVLERDAVMRPYTAVVALIYQKNGFKLLYRTENEERSFLELAPEEPLETRFMFFDLKCE